jgi:hypothetical protein
MRILLVDARGGGRAITVMPNRDVLVAAATRARLAPLRGCQRGGGGTIRSTSRADKVQKLFRLNEGTYWGCRRPCGPS